MNKRLDDRLAKKLIKMQFEAIGACYDGESCTAGDWFRLQAWTSAQKEAFRLKFMKAISKQCRSAATREHLWSWWDLNYGWKDQEEREPVDTDD